MAVLTGTERQKNYRDRMKQCGFIEVMLWVHQSDRDELKRYAQKLRSKFLDNQEPEPDNTAANEDQPDWLS